MIHGTLMRTMLQHRDLDGVRLAHHGAVEGLAPFALVVALDVHLERVPQVDGVRERHVERAELVAYVGHPARETMCVSRTFGVCLVLRLSVVHLLQVRVALRREDPRRAERQGDGSLVLGLHLRA